MAAERGPAGRFESLPPLFKSPIPRGGCHNTAMEELGEWQGGKLEGCVQRDRGGWKATWSKKPKHSKYFSDKKHGGDDGAREAAEAYRGVYALAHGRVKNQWRICGRKDEEYVEVQLQEGEDRFLMCDLVDLPTVEAYTWYSWTSQHRDGSKSGCVYASTHIGKMVVKFHRLLHPEWEMIDHDNGNGLDNRRSNLLDGSDGKNSLNWATRTDNTSGTTGVSYDTANQRWIAHITIKRKGFHARFPGPNDKNSEAFLAACEWRNAEAEKVGNRNGRRPARM